MKVAEGQHKEAKLDRSDVAEGEGLWRRSGARSLCGRSQWQKKLAMEGWCWVALGAVAHTTPPVDTSSE